MVQCAETQWSRGRSLTNALIFISVFSVLASTASAQSNAGAISVVGGVYLFHSDFGYGWIPLSTVQLAYSRPSESRVRVDWNVDYTYYKHTLPSGNMVTEYVVGNRQDFAVYPSIVLSDLIQLGIGLNYSYRNSTVTNYSGRPSPVTNRIESFIRPYYQFAIIPRIGLTGRIGLRIGLSYRDQDVDGNTIPIAFRGGITVGL